MLAPHANLRFTQDQSVTVGPATNPSDATISAITSCGARVSVVIAIATRATERWSRWASRAARPNHREHPGERRDAPRHGGSPPRSPRPPLPPTMASRHRPRRFRSARTGGNPELAASAASDPAERASQAGSWRMGEAEPAPARGLLRRERGTPRSPSSSHLHSRGHRQPAKLVDRRDVRERFSLGPAIRTPSNELRAAPSR